MFFVTLAIFLFTKKLLFGCPHVYRASSLPEYESSELTPEHFIRYFAGDFAIVQTGINFTNSTLVE